MKVVHDLYLERHRGKNKPHQLSVELTYHPDGQWEITKAYNLTTKRNAKLSYWEEREVMHNIAERVEWDGRL